MRVEETAGRFVAALAAHDHRTIRSLLAPDVWLRALLTRQVAEARDAGAALELLSGWVAGPTGFEVHEIVADGLEPAGVAARARVRYRFRLRPAWAPDTWHVIEQTGYLRVGADDRITRIDLACTGYHAA